MMTTLMYTLHCTSCCSSTLTRHCATTKQRFMHSRLGFSMQNTMPKTSTWEPWHSYQCSSPGLVSQTVSSMKLAGTLCSRQSAQSLPLSKQPASRVWRSDWLMESRTQYIPGHSAMLQMIQSSTQYHRFSVGKPSVNVSGAISHLTNWQQWSYLPSTGVWNYNSKSGNALLKNTQSARKPEIKKEANTGPIQTDVACLALMEKIMNHVSNSTLMHARYSAYLHIWTTPHGDSIETLCKQMQR